MNKLTLEKTWTYCLSMWRWIAAQRKAGDNRIVWYLKRAWMENNDFENISECCFFCEYDFYLGKESCDSCPARKIDKNFYCENTEYHWCNDPIKFYNELVSLNRKRLAMKEAKNVRN